MGDAVGQKRQVLLRLLVVGGLDVAHQLLKLQRVGQGTFNAADLEGVGGLVVDRVIVVKRALLKGLQRFLGYQIFTRSSGASHTFEPSSTPKAL
ncbi:hypothetical protein JKI95_06355 [Corynebacterium aquatimens]|uniref:hypothetical protein n=1 Tax=Corynebacterium aquatimens TaxID=1190508 RepID=UPI003EBE8DE1|nr:hypothetical protein JKI95_06355 [Corynebacterium aquatimens]